MKIGTLRGTLAGKRCAERSWTTVISVSYNTVNKLIKKCYP